MPRTASSQVQPRSSSKARPSANVRAGNLVANTPVLFRLPAIATAPAQELAVTFSEAALNLPTATLAAVSLSSPAPYAAPAPMPVEPVSNVSVAPHAAPQQTWWEHWSSGIVLIVLLIALATASILAWQGSSKGNSKLLADTKESESQSDLSSIEVPKIENLKLDVPKLEMPVSTKSNSYVDRLEPPSAQNTRSQNNNPQSNPSLNSSFDQKSNDMDSSLIPDESLSLTLDPPTMNETKFELEPHATASLQSPVVKPQEPLFKDNDVTQPKSILSAQPASTPTQRNATNGDKPSLWDNSKANVHDSNKPLSLEFSSNDSSSLNNLSTPENPPVSESPTAAKMASQSTTEATSYVAEPTAATLVPKEMQNAARTVTPEMDQAELIAAYRKLYAPTAPTKAQNLYRIAAAGTQPQPGAPAGTQAAVVGYTQPSATQPNVQSAPVNNNYTLQNQQYQNPQYQNSQYQSPQYQSPQYQNSQYQNSQYQNSQYQNSQYQNSQYQNSQYQVPQYSNQPQNSSLPQYSTQSQPGTQNSNSLQMQGANDPSWVSSGLQYGGAQVPYTAQPSQAQSQQIQSQQIQALQLPPGPIGGYGAQPATQGGTAGSMQSNKPSSPNYPSMQ